MRAVLHQPSEATGEGTRVFEAKDLDAHDFRCSRKLESSCACIRFSSVQFSSVQFIGFR